MIIEICTFRLAPGVDDASFLGEDARMQQEFVYQQRGALRRTAARDRDGDWAVITLWQADDDAAGAAEEAVEHPVAASWRSRIDATSVQIRRFEALA